jgi:hypothetical protein
MEATQEPTSPALDAGLGPIGLFLIKTVIVSAAIVLSAWILDAIIRKHCVCMNETMDNNETCSITQWAKANPAARHACDANRAGDSRPRH